MTDSTAAPTRNDTWTVDTYAAHNEALRAAEARLQDMRDNFLEERDRRYAEVATEREKALKIKETADLAALGLAREIQTYKDEKANELREQIGSERGNYATKEDLLAAIGKIEVAMQPLSEFRLAQQGKGEGISATAKVLVAVLGAVATLLTIFAFWSTAHRTQPTPVVVTPTATTP